MPTRQPFKAPVRVVTLLALCCVNLLSGCGQLRSIDERALITGIAMDRGKEPGTVEVMLQWYHGGEPAQASTGGGGGGTSVLLANRGGVGRGVADAVGLIQSRTDRQFNFGVTQVVLVSEDLAREGLTRYLDYLWRKPEFPQLAHVIVVRGKAGEMLESGGPSGTAFRLYQYTLTARAAAAGTIPIPFWRFLALSYSGTEDAWAPLIALEKGHFSGVGTAVFQGDRMTGALGKPETAALSWVLHAGGFEGLSAVIPNSAAPLSLHVQTAAVRRWIDSQGSGHLQLALTTELQEGYRINLFTEGPASLEAAAAEAALVDIRSAVTALQSARSDVMGFGEWLRERSPSDVTSDWANAFARLPVVVDVTVRIHASGGAA